MQQEMEDKSVQFKSGEYGVSANSKFLFMKWKRDFFGMNKMCIINQKETDKVEVPFWVFAQYLFLRVMNESISHGGKLRFDEDMPYSPVLLAETFGLDAELAKRAFSLFERYNLVKWDEEKSLIIPCAMANIGQQGAGSSTERSRKCRAAKKLRELGEKANSNGVQRDCNTMQRCSNACNAKEKEKDKEEEIDKEIESTPHNPPQGGEADVRAEQDGHTEYPLERIQRAYDEAVLTSGGKVREEHKEAFCRFLYENGKLENTRRIRNLPGYVKTLYPSWIADGGHHADATQITREELAEWVREYNPKVGDGEKVTKEMEDGFWGWLVAAGFKNGKGILMTKWNIGGPITAWVENRRKEAGRQGTRQSVADDLMHMRGLGVKPWNIDFKRNETI